MNDLRRVVAVLLQVVIPGCIGAFFTFVVAGTMSTLRSPLDPLPFVVLAGPVVGLLTWLFGLIADRGSGERLLLTVLYSALGCMVSYLLLLFGHWLQPRPYIAPPVPFALAIAIGVGTLLAPIAGAMAGYYWVRGKQRTTPSVG